MKFKQALHSPDKLRDIISDPYIRHVCELACVEVDHLSEDTKNKNNKIKTIIEPVNCNGVQHSPGYGLCPGVGWVREKVQTRCTHYQRVCWVKRVELDTANYTPCNEFIHVPIKTCKTPPDNNINWEKKIVRNACIHRDKTCWVRLVNS